MDEQAILRQINNYDEESVTKALQRIYQMQDHLNAIRSGEVEAHKEWANSSELIFPEDFTEGMRELSKDLHPIEKLLKQTERIEAALKWQDMKLKKMKK